MMDTIPVPETSPQLIYDIRSGLEKTMVLYVALNFNIFDSLKEYASVEIISETLHTNPHITEKLLNCLVSLELLVKKDMKYKNTQLSQTFLTKDSAFFIGNTLALYKNSFQYWMNLEHILKNDRVCELKDSASKKINSESFTKSMSEWAMSGVLNTTVEAVTKLEQFQTAQRLLDLGGSHGLYSIAFAQKNMNLDVIVFDRPDVVKETKTYLEKYQMEKRIKTIGGDLLCDDIGSGYDIVFASGVFYMPPVKQPDTFQKVRRSLSDSGMFFLKQWTMTSDRTNPAHTVFWDFWLSLSGRAHHCYSESEYEKQLYDAGFSSVEILESESHEPSLLLVAHN